MKQSIKSFLAGAIAVVILFALSDRYPFTMFHQGMATALVIVAIVAAGVKAANLWHRKWMDVYAEIHELDDRISVVDEKASKRNFKKVARVSYLKGNK
jgi:hypothetical protein